MGEENDRRIEPRLSGASRGISPTTEQIESLLQQREHYERMTRPPPQTSFAAVLKDRQNSDQSQSQDDASSEQITTSPQDDDIHSSSDAALTGAAPKSAAISEPLPAGVPLVAMVSGAQSPRRMTAPPPTVRAAPRLSSAGTRQAQPLLPPRPAPTGAPFGSTQSPHLQGGGQKRKYIVRG